MGEKEGVFGAVLVEGGVCARGRCRGSGAIFSAWRLAVDVEVRGGRNKYKVFLHQAPVGLEVRNIE